MNYQRFRELCEACYISRVDVKEEYDINPTKPWSSSSRDYTNDKRENDAKKFLDDLFSECDELSINELSNNIFNLKKRLDKEYRKGPLRSIVGNICVAVAKSASNSFNKYLELLSEELDIDELWKNGKPSPYGNMQFQIFTEDI